MSSIKKQSTPAQMIIISFIMIILAGTILLILPISTMDKHLSWIDALFLSVSATCVTGLSVIDIGTRLTGFGQWILLGLIQLGGLGIMTFSTFFIYLLGKQASIRSRSAIDTTLSHTPFHNVEGVLKRIIFVVFGIEFFGAALLFPGFLVTYPLAESIKLSVFHSISAFCNAGFSLFSNSFVGFQFNFYINTILMILIVLGGLGFIVLFDLLQLQFYKSKSLHRISFHSKIVLFTSLVLIILGTVLFYWVEHSHSLAGMGHGQSLLVSFFQSVTSRTAGFNTVPVDEFSNGACLVIMLLMFIGAAPGSCGGGVKVTTIGILFTLFFSRMRGFNEPHIFNRSISLETVGKALVIVISAVLIIAMVFGGLLLTEDWSRTPQESRGDFLSLLFESISAFGTVGLSMGITSQLSSVGKLFIILLMFVGRLGPLTLAVGMLRSSAGQRYKYARGEVMVG